MVVVVVVEEDRHGFPLDQTVPQGRTGSQKIASKSYQRRPTKRQAHKVALGRPPDTSAERPVQARTGTLADRTKALRQQLVRLTHHTHEEDALSDIDSELQNLILEYTRYTQAVPEDTPSTGRSNRPRQPRQGLDVGHSRSTGEHGSKRPIAPSHDESAQRSTSLVANQDQILDSISKVLRCFYFFEKDSTDIPCDAKKKTVRDLMSVNEDRS